MRDPQRWFQDLLIDKGALDGLAIDDPVITLVNGREGLIGRITYLEPHAAKVMLIQDSLSAVPATASDSATEDGVIEGNNTHDLTMKFLSRDSKLKMGDLAVTSGLGGVFPAGIPVGWVQELGPDPRQLFLQARIRMAVSGNELRSVLILVHPSETPNS